MNKNNLLQRESKGGIPKGSKHPIRCPLSEKVRPATGRGKAPRKQWKMEREASLHQGYQLNGTGRDRMKTEIVALYPYKV